MIVNNMKPNTYKRMLTPSSTSHTIVRIPWIDDNFYSELDHHTVNVETLIRRLFEANFLMWPTYSTYSRQEMNEETSKYDNKVFTLGAPCAKHSMNRL